MSQQHDIKNVIGPQWLCRDIAPVETSPDQYKQWDVASVVRDRRQTGLFERSRSWWWWRHGVMKTSTSGMKYTQATQGRFMIKRRQTIKNRIAKAALFALCVTLEALNAVAVVYQSLLLIRQHLVSCEGNNDGSKGFRK